MLYSQTKEVQIIQQISNKEGEKSKLIKTHDQIGLIGTCIAIGKKMIMNGLRIWLTFQIKPLKTKDDIQL